MKVWFEATTRRVYVRSNYGVQNSNPGNGPRRGARSGYDGRSGIARRPNSQGQNLNQRRSMYGMCMYMYVL